MMPDELMISEAFRRIGKQRFLKDQGVQSAKPRAGSGETASRA